MTQNTPSKLPWHYLLVLILAGETIFILPFVLARVFRPTFLAVFQINNFQLGTSFSVYGLVALVSYLLGGPLADKFKPRILMAVGLFLTALGGVYMSTFPTTGNLKLLFGYFGFTTIFLFWSAMIKATRVWGGSNRQGRAFGFLDGGRGAVGALFGTLGVFIFSQFISANLEMATLVERQQAFRAVILVSSFLVALIGLLVLFFLRPNGEENNIVKNTQPQNQSGWKNLKSVAKIPSVWWLMVIILCAYVGYKITDVFSLFANEVMLYNELESAKIGAFLLYFRPVVGISIGILADKTRASLLLIFGFVTMLLGALVFSFQLIDVQTSFLFFVSVIAIALGTYAVRSLYFAVLQQGKIPLALTGTAVGLISFIGYTPDIFVGPAMGYLLDNSPGAMGHQHVFIMLAIFSFFGFLASLGFYRSLHNK